jgi:glycolate oxidase
VTEPPTPSASVPPSRELLQRFRTICGDAHVFTDATQLRTYESDGLMPYRAKPGAVVMPGSADEVRDVVRACAEAGVSWVARGAGSGLSGGALPVPDGVVIVVTRMRRVLEVDLENGRIVVEPGVTNSEVSAYVGPTHFYPPDPSSQVVCSIGGNVAENSGGAHCFKYGVTTNYVTGLEVVLPDGEVVTLGGKEVDHPGYDLLGAFVGSEGTLGICTAITLRVIPVPEAMETMVAFFQTTSEAGEAVSAIVSDGVVPGAIEMMDTLTIEATQKAADADFPLDVGAALIIELDGSRDECEARLGEVVHICEASGAIDIRVARDEAERAAIWKTRKAAFAAMGRVTPYYYVQDGVIPRTRLPEALARISALAADYGMRVGNVFHAGDGNLHPLICYQREDELGKAEELSARILDICVELGGSITGEHGVGVDKKTHMPSMFNEADLAAFQHLRCAFDPAGLANPGKVMPTPRLCGEVPGPYRRHQLELDGIAERF